MHSIETKCIENGGKKAVVGKTKGRWYTVVVKSSGEEHWSVAFSFNKKEKEKKIHAQIRWRDVSPRSTLGAGVYLLYTKNKKTKNSWTSCWRDVQPRTKPGTGFYLLKKKRKFYVDVMFLLALRLRSSELVLANQLIILVLGRILQLTTTSDL